MENDGAIETACAAVKAGQIPIVLFFVVKWLLRSPRQALPVLALQVGAAIAAVTPVFLLGW